MATTRNARSTRTKSDVIEVNFDDYEETTVYMGDDPRAGVYPFRLAKVERHIAQSSGNKGIRWTFICEDPSYEGWAGFMYSNTDADSALFKTQQILAAVQGGNTKPVKLDLANPDKFLATCKPVIGRVKSESYEGDDGEVRTSAKLTRVVAASAVPQVSAKGNGRAKDDDYDDDFEDADDAGDEEGFEDDELREELEGKTIRELRTLAKKDYGLTVEDIKGLDKAALIDEMLEAAEDSDEDEPEEDEDDEGFDDVDEDGSDEDDADDTEEDAEDAEEDTPTQPTRSRSGRGRSRSEAPAKAASAKKASPATRRRRG